MRSNAMKRQDIITEARKWLGVPWRHQGRCTAGVDCVGLLVVTAWGLGFTVEDYTNYQRRTQGLQFLQHFQKHMIQVPVHSSALSDVVILREPRLPCHCGIVSEKDGHLHLIHAHMRRRKVIEELLTEEWHNRIVATFTWPDLED